MAQEVVLEDIGCHFGSCWGHVCQYVGCFCVNFLTLRGYIGVISGMFRGCFGDVSGRSRRCFGDVSGTFHGRFHDFCECFGGCVLNLS